MGLTKDQKKKILTEHGRSKRDSGSVEVQVSLLTQRINDLDEHFKTNVKDHHSRYGLIKMVGQRRRLLSYLRRTAPDRYQALIERLDLRK